MIPPHTAALLARATSYALVPVVYEAFEDGFAVDLLVTRGSAAGYVVAVLVLDGDRIETDMQFDLGGLGDMDPEVQAAVLLAWVMTIEAGAARTLLKVERALAAGRT